MKENSKINSEYFKNEIRLKLLTILPDFQNDVRRVRQELGIPHSGFMNNSELSNWHKALINETDKVMNSKWFLDASKGLNVAPVSDRIKQEWDLNDKVPLFRMEHRKIELGKKYKLPANFYEENVSSGLFVYITMNKVVPPSSNWVIQHDPDGRMGTTRWLAVKAYAILSKSEIKNAMNTLASLQRHYLPKEVVVSSRVKKRFERDLLIYKELMLDRNKKPVRTKKYEGGSYLTYMKGNSSISKKRIRELEKIHRQFVYVDFDATTSRDVAKKYHMTPGAVRKSVERVNDLITSYFGIRVAGQ